MAPEKQDVIDDPEVILDFWFSEAVRPRWFDATPDLDRAIRERFEPTWQAALEGHLGDWAKTPRGALALVIVLDQFPLNMFRGEPESFSTEDKARAVARPAIDAGWDEGLTGEEKAFLYLPFMHSESVADQDISVALYEKIGNEAGLKWARHHRDLVRRFGRFPHRNAILRRENTPEEAAYLASEEAYLG